MAETSQNGWTIDPPRSARTVTDGGVRVVVRDGPAGDVLAEFIRRFDARVENVDQGADDWGYAHRVIAGSTIVSNHASATAVDLNATRHPQHVHGTFSTTQVTEIRKIIRELGSVIRWGGDYSGSTVDEMHFEIIANPAAVARVAAELTQEQDMTQRDVDNIRGFLWEGGPSTKDNDPNIKPTSIMGRLQNVEGFLFKGGPSTRDEDNLGVSPDSVMGRLKATEQTLAAIQETLAEIHAAVTNPSSS